MNAISHYQDKVSLKKIFNEFKLLIPENKEIAICCIGTTRSTGDALGPLVGSYLKKKRNLNHIHIFGDMKKPVHALNLSETINEIKSNNYFVIAVDACLGRRENVQKIKFVDEPTFPGSGVGKELPCVGDISIKGIINIGGHCENLVLQNTDLNIVIEMSETIGKLIVSLLKEKK